MVERRTDRGFAAGGEPPFTEAQRIWLLERDFDLAEIGDQELRREVEQLRLDMNDGFEKMRATVSGKLNWIMTSAFGVMALLLGVLVTAIVSRA